MSTCDLLPDLVKCEDFSKYNAYRDRVYKIFRNVFIDNSVIWKGRVICVNTFLDDDGYPKGFRHITGRDYSKDGTRYPDFRRSERINWIKPMIEQSEDICPRCIDDFCDGIKVWSRPFKNTERTIFLSEEESYVVIIEPKKNFYILITAFYIDDDNEMDDFLKSYEEYKN